MEFKRLYLPDLIRWDPESLTDTYGRLEIIPLERGFARTLGNSLRRVMLSSLEGASPVTMRIEGIEHEFTTVPGVAHDVPEILLNIKSLIVHMEDEEQGTMKLSARKKGVYRAEDLECSDGLTVINGEQEIAELTRDAELDLEVLVERGKGFISAEEWIDTDRNVGIGTVLLDSWFCPVTKVNYKVQSARVGNRTDYDHLIMDVETNGSISPEEAVDTACEILIRHFSMIPGGLEPEPEPEEPEVPEEEPERPSTENIPLGDTEIPTRIVNVLEAGGVPDLETLVSYTEDELKQISGFGPSSLEKVLKVLNDMGLGLKE